MTVAFVLAASGAFALLAAAITLRTLGPRFRIGRILSVAPELSIAEAVRLAGGPVAYVRVTGRISSDEEFPDEHDRPLVFRRTRVEVKEPAGVWRVVVDEREAVPFGVETRSEFIAVDETALGPGLIAIPREASGKVADLPPELTNSTLRGMDPETPARLIIEQLSAVEHATVCGRPDMREGQPVLTEGTGRPLIVTPLETPAAMRLLAGGYRGRVLASAACLVVGLGLLAGAIVALIAAI